MPDTQYYRRKAAGEYLKNKYGFGSAKTLAKLGCLGGGPPIIYANRIPLYTKEALDFWALSKLSAPVSSTSERQSSTHDPVGARAGSVG